MLPVWWLLKTKDLYCTIAYWSEQKALELYFSKLYSDYLSKLCSQLNSPSLFSFEGQYSDRIGKRLKNVWPIFKELSKFIDTPEFESRKQESYRDLVLYFWGNHHQRNIRALQRHTDFLNKNSLMIFKRLNRYFKDLKEKARLALKILPQLRSLELGQYYPNRSLIRRLIKSIKCETSKSKLLEIEKILKG